MDEGFRRIVLDYEGHDDDFDHDPFVDASYDESGFNFTESPDWDHAGTPGQWDRIADAWQEGDEDHLNFLMETSERGGQAPPLRTRLLTDPERPIHPVKVSYLPCPKCDKPHDRRLECE